MSEYENKIYELLTSSKEKFKSSFEIAKHLNMVKKELIIRFWKDVEKELNYLIKNSKSDGKDFKVMLDSDVLHRYSKCYLYLNDNTKARILYQNLAEDQCIGVWVDAQKVDHEKINDYINEPGNDIPNLIKSPWWVSYERINENFNHFDSLLMILPQHSEEYSKRKAKDLFDFALVNKEHLRFIGSHCFK